MDLDELGVKGKDGEDMGEREVWTPKREGWNEEVIRGVRYLSVNAATLDAGQEGLDLREWHEKGWIAYLDCKDYAEEDRLGRPFEGGIY